MKIESSSALGPIQIERLRADRRTLESRIRALKSVLRSPWTTPMAESQRELHVCKREATELCILRAWLRGNLHLPDVERCREVAERRAPTYADESAVCWGA